MTERSIGEIPSTGARLLDLALWMLCALGIAYLAWKCVQVAPRAGYDFKYLWLAGELWWDGITAYGPRYPEIGATLITEGNLPEKWVYPPSWWPITVALAQTDLLTAAIAWNIACVIMLLIASWLIVESILTLRERAHLPIWAPLWPLMRTGPLFCLHVFAMAVLESSALVLSVGQTSMLIYLGMAMLLWGLVHGVRVVGVLGLVCLFLKPQLGLIFAVTLFLRDGEGRMQVILAGVISAILCIPAMLVSPLALWEFVQNVIAYDGFTVANLPQSMTGIRILLWEGFGRDIGNIWATMITLALAVLAVVLWLRGEDGSRAGPELSAWIAVAAMAALIAAFAPLHYYDHVVVGILPFLFLLARLAWSLVAALGAVLLWRADTLGRLTGWHGEDVEIFVGSRIATVASIILCLAVLGALASLRRQAMEHRPGQAVP